MRFDNAAKLDKPAMVTLEEGTYYWCRCVHLRRQNAHSSVHVRAVAERAPRCDGAHKDY